MSIGVTKDYKLKVKKPTIIFDVGVKECFGCSKEIVRTTRLRPEVVKRPKDYALRLNAPHKNTDNGLRRCAFIFRFDPHAGRLIC
jgi:hypothetical protein